MCQFAMYWKLMCDVCLEVKADQEFFVNQCNCNFNVCKACFKTIENLDRIYKWVMSRTHIVRDRFIPTVRHASFNFLEPQIGVVAIGIVPPGESTVLSPTENRTAKRNWRFWFQELAMGNFWNSYWEARGNPNLDIIHNTLNTKRFNFRTEAGVCANFFGWCLVLGDIQP